MFKKNRLILFFSVLLILMLAAANEAAEVIETKLDEVAKVFETYFPTVEGVVTSVEDKVIRINLGKKSGLLQGMILPVIKEGKEFQHPVTKEVLGRHEVEIGYIELKEVRDESSAGSLIVENKEPVRNGDKVRITAGRIKVALIPATTEANVFIIDRFADALEETGRFAVIPPDEIERIKKEHPDENAIGLSKRVADAFKIINLFIVNTAPSKDKTLLTVELIAIPGNAKIAGLTALLRLPSKGPLTIEDDPQFKAFVVKKKNEFWKKEEMPFGIRWLSVGDVDGDGKNEIVVSNGNRLRIYRYTDGRFVQIWEEKDAKRAYDHLYLDVADINKNGRAEIYVTNLIKDRLYSYVIEWRDGDFKKIQKEIPVFFRVLERPDGKRLLLCQEMGVKEPFYGDVKRCDWNEEKYIMGERFPLPKGVNIYGFAISDLDGDGEDEVISVDDEDYIRIYAVNGTQIWRSPERYGGYDTSFDFDYVENVSGAKEKRVKIKGRLFVKDIDGDGRQELILSKNVPTTYAIELFRGYLYGQMYVFHWDGLNLNEVWKIKKVAGFIEDYTVSDFTNEGFDRLLLVTSPLLSVSKIEELFKTKSDFIIYHLPERG